MLEAALEGYVERTFCVIGGIAPPFAYMLYCICAVILGAEDIRGSPPLSDAPVVEKYTVPSAGIACVGLWQAPPSLVVQGTAPKVLGTRVGARLPATASA